MEYSELIEKRYSVRQFKSEPLTQAELDAILHAGHVAPTGCNNQPQRIYVLQSEQALAALKDCTKCHFDAPNAMVICYNKDEVWRRRYDGKSCGVCDASIVTTHMMLKATDLGIGTTWVMSFDPAAVVQVFDIPENTVPVAILVMGYPADDATPRALHTTFRPMEELVEYK